MIGKLETWGDGHPLSILTAALLFCMAAATAAVSDDHTYSMKDLPAGGLFFATEVPGQVRQVTTLKTNVTISVSGPIARTTVVQHFENTSASFVEAIYTFPLPEDSAVDRLIMSVGGREIKGIIQEKAKAREIFEQARRDGKRASLVSEERPNMFSTELTNIAPGDKISVTIEYQETLMIDAMGGSMRFPMVVRPRYSPGMALSKPDQQGSGWALDTTIVDDASRITPPVANPYGPKINPVTLSVSLNPGFALKNILSISHPIVVEDLGEGRFTVKPTAGSVPADKDFLLVWEAEDASVPTAGLFSETLDGEEYHLLMIMPPNSKTGSVDKRVKELVIILDKSGSMGGEAMREAKDAVKFAIDQLSEGDSLNIIAFDDGAYPLYSKAKQISPQVWSEAHDFVQRIEAGGGTNMLSSLTMALDGLSDPNRIRQVIFITDGAVGNEEELFRQINTRLGDSRLFTVGIGAAPNSFFMTEAAEAGRGTFTYIAEPQEVDVKMHKLFADITAPTLSDLALTWDKLGAFKGMDTLNMYPSTLADLYQGAPLMVSLKTKSPMHALELTGRRGDEMIKLSVDPRSIPSDGVAALWGRAKIRDLKRVARRNYDGGWEELQAEGLKTALAFSLVSEWTSLIAVDDEPVRKPGEVLLKEAMATNLPADMVADAFTAPPPMLSLRSDAITAALPMPAGATPAPLLLLIGLLLLMLAWLISMKWKRT